MALCDGHLLRQVHLSRRRAFIWGISGGCIRRDERSFAAVDVSRC